MLGKPPNKYCFLIGQTLVMSLLYETHIGDVITLCFLVLKCFHQFSCSSHQKQGSPSTITHPLQLGDVPLANDNHNDRTWRAFEFERAVWTSLGEWKKIYLESKWWWCHKRVFNKYSWCWESLPTNTAFWLDRHWWCHYFMRHTLVMSSLYAFWSWNVSTNFPAVLAKNKAHQVRSMAILVYYE